MATISKTMQSIKLMNYSNGSLSIIQNQQVLLSSSSTTYRTTRYYSDRARRPNFISQFIDNIKQEMQKNKEMKESLKKFREEAEKLEQSDALKSARQKFHNVESEANKSSEVIKEKLDIIKDKVQDVIDEAGKSEFGKKAGKLSDELTSTINEKTQAFGKTNAYKKMSNTAKIVTKELDTNNIDGRVYTPLKKLRKRKEIIDNDEKIYKVNDDVTGIELHKDSKFYEQWKNFKNNNQYVDKLLDWKIKYEESDNPLIRVSRLLTDRVTNVVSGLFEKTKLSETLTEICKTNPNFDKTQFLHDCQTDIIPNILEAMIRGELDILKDWCHEAQYNAIAQPILQAKKIGYRLDSKILDIDNVDILMGEVMDGHGPVLMISFQTQQIMCVRDSKNNVIEGDPDKIMRIQHVWALSHDNSEMNPKAAWKLLELSSSATEQFV